MERTPKIMNRKVQEQILAFMNNGFTIEDMLYTPDVERRAAELGYDELVDCLQNDARGYVKFVFTKEV